MDKEKERERMKQYREYYKAHHICIGCRRRETYFGHVYCPDCLEKMRAYMAKNKEKESARKKAYRARLKAQGICITCGKRAAVPNRVVCEECAERNKARNRRLYAKKTQGNIPRYRWGGDYGMCVVCKAPVKKGYRVCEKHYNHLAEIRYIKTPTRIKAQKDWAEREKAYNERAIKKHLAKKALMKEKRISTRGTWHD